MSQSEVRQEWEIRIAAYRASEQSAAEWCAAHGTGYSTTMRLIRLLKLIDTSYFYRCRQSHFDYGARMFKYLVCLIKVSFGNAFSLINSCMAGGYAGFLSKVITRGF
jgi:hypothetical protein